MVNYKILDQEENPEKKVVESMKEIYSAGKQLAETMKEQGLKPSPYLESMSDPEKQKRLEMLTDLVEGTNEPGQSRN